MKKFISIASILALSISVVACDTTENETTQPETPVENTENADVTTDEEVTDEEMTEEETDLSGTYVGYSWKGESKGTTLEEAKQKIETTLELDKDGNIVSAKMDFLKMDSEGNWYARNDASGSVEVDFSVDPTVATPGEEYADGSSMFNFDVTDKMSLYAVAVDEDNTVAYGFVDPMNRYLYEMKFEPGYDFANMTVADMTINNGFVPTVRTSTGGIMKPSTWEDISDVSMLKLGGYSYVINMRGDYQGISEETTVEELLILSGVDFVEGVPQPKDAEYAFHSQGGWAGNYNAVAENLVGMNVMDMTSLIDFDVKYADSVNEDNFFGVNTDTVATATKSVQNSYDTISGATVRFSRENTSFQRALVEAGIISEEEVVKGRF